MKSFLAALGFLTIVPIPRAVHENSGALKGAVWWFPFIGFLMGAVLATLDRVFGLVFPPGVRSVLIVLSLLILSRGIHMDGLADTADGLLSFRPREKMLEIMRDPRAGPMGVMAVAGALALKMAAVCSLPEPGRGMAILVMPVAGRSAIGFLMGLFPYARAEGGLATAFQTGHRRALAMWAGLWFLTGATGTRGGTGLIAAGTGLALLWCFGAWVNGKIGGYTGDTLGATCELTEVYWMLLSLVFE